MKELKNQFSLESVEHNDVFQSNLGGKDSHYASTSQCITCFFQETSQTPVQTQKARSMGVNRVNRFPAHPHISLSFSYSVRFLQN